jgi:predicted metal-dependent hydrolase
MREGRKERMIEVEANKKGILNRTKSRFPKQIRNSSNPLPTSRKGRCSYSSHPIVSPFHQSVIRMSRKEGREKADDSLERYSQGADEDKLQEILDEIKNIARFGRV